MRQILIFGLLALTLLAACGGEVTEQAPGSGNEQVAEVYKPPT